MLKFEVLASEMGVRIDRFVTTRMREQEQPCTRSDVQRWIAAGLVLVEGQPVAKKHAVRVGAVVTVEPGPPPLSDAEPDASVHFDVVFEDEHLLVVDKPPGLVVHPARGHRTGTLVNGLLARPGFSAVSADPRDPDGHLRPGIVHRLDKDTSGLLVVAKNAVCREGLKALFAEHDIERCYLAIVIGKGKRMRIDTLHGRHPKSRKRFTSLVDPARKKGIRRACTDVEPVRSIGACTLVRCTLETGRTHQIRVHMTEQMKAAVLGDTLYRRNVSDPRIQEIGDALGRQALHAAVLGIVHPITGETMRWESDMPADMRGALEALEALD